MAFQTTTKATAQVTVVTIDQAARAAGETKYTDTLAYFESIEDARVAAVAMITARGWHLTGDPDGQDHYGTRARFLSGETEGQIVWQDDTETGETVHVGAVYASKLSKPASVVRKYK